MDRKKKIIVSITGIFVVILTLLGLTYAYFVTQIQGNDNDKSIEVTTANLRLVYRDGTPTILSKTNIQPGDTIGSKTFTVTNEGNKTVDNYVVYLESVTNTFENKSDVTYVLNCTSSVSNKICNGTSENIYPSTNKILVSNSIDVSEVQTYEIFVYYKDNGTDQSIDMNKEITGKLNIKDPKTINPYATISGITESSNTTLAYNIINNAKQGLNGTKFVNTPPTKVAEEISNENEKVLSITNDDYGTSYYFRGSVKDNYVDYDNKCWRIVRIEGDGSVKLILASDNGVCENDSNLTDESGWNGSGAYCDNNWASDGYLSSNLKLGLDNELASINQTKLKEDSWCVEDTQVTYLYDGTLLTLEEKNQEIDENYGTVYYETNNRLTNLKKSTLKCNGLIFSSKIGTLTADEVTYAGGFINQQNNSYYLIENANSTYIEGSFLLTLSDLDEGNGESVFVLFTSGNLSYTTTYSGDNGWRDSIVLIPDVKIVTGNGTQTNPYVINMES